MSEKKDIIALFSENVKGKSPDISDKNVEHDGRCGHWLEQQFGVKANANNDADLWGYELKNETTSKTTFGDWSANEYVFTNPQYEREFSGKKKYEKQWSFCRIFGKPNESKGGRYSWSGQPVPKYGKYNDFGQIMLIEPKNRNIVAVYSYSKDMRADKATIVPRALQIENLVIARWYGDCTPSGKKGKCLSKKLEDKFNQQGWFTCKMVNGVYDKICFGAKVDYDQFINCVMNGIVYLDSGMYDGRITEEQRKNGKKENKRPYSEWRASNKFWNSLILEEFK